MVIFIVISIFIVVFAGTYFWSNTHQLSLHDYRSDIENELKIYGLELVKMQTPSTKEMMASPFGWVEPALRIGGMSITLHEKITQKVIFKNQNGVIGETWLQIRRNRWNGEVTNNWDPMLVHFRHLKEETRF